MSMQQRRPVRTTPGAPTGPQESEASSHGRLAEPSLVGAQLAEPAPSSQETPILSAAAMALQDTPQAEGQAGAWWASDDEGLQGPGTETDAPTQSDRVGLQDGPSAAAPPTAPGGDAGPASQEVGGSEAASAPVFTLPSSTAATLPEPAPGPASEGGERRLGTFRRESTASVPQPTRVDAHLVGASFTELGPTDQAHAWSGLGEELEDAANEEQEQWVQGVELGTLEAPEPVPEPRRPAPLALGAPTLPSAERSPPAPARAEVDPSVGATWHVTPEGERVQSAPGPEPILPLDGSADPQRMDAVVADAAPATAEAGAEVAAAIDGVQGVEGIRAPTLEHPTRLDPVDRIRVEAPPESPEMSQYLGLGMGPQVEQAYDEEHGPAHRASLEQGLHAPLADESRRRESERKRLLLDADQDQRGAMSQANSGQDRAIEGAQQDIAAHQDQAREKQEQAIAEQQATIDARQAKDQAKLGQRGATDQQRVNKEYDKARDTADKHVQDAEREADAHREQYEEDLKNPPKRDIWDEVWGAITDFFDTLFDALLQAINFVFDTVRSIVTAVFDALSAMVSAIMDAFVAFATLLLDVFADFVKDVIINQLIGAIFPEIVDELCALVDGVVSLATEIVERVGATLRDALVGIITAIGDVINAYVSFYQMYISTIVNLAHFLTTGDWRAFISGVLTSALSIAGIPSEVIDEFIGNVEETIERLIEDPGGFMENVITAVGGGFEQFGDNFLDHFSSGFLKWITGELGDITMPKQLDVEGILDLVLQVLHLTPMHLRQKAVDRIGPEAVTAIEFVWGFVEAGINGGFEGLIEHMDGKLDDLVNLVVGGISNWLIERVVTEAATKISSSSTGIGSIVQALITAYDFYQFLKKDMERIVGVIMSVVEAMRDIARGVTAGASNNIEKTLGGMIPVAISMLAQLLHIDGIGDTVRGIIAELRGMIDAGIDALIDTVFGWFTSGGDEAEDLPPEEQALSALKQVEDQMVQAVATQTTDDGACRDLLTDWVSTLSAHQALGGSEQVESGNAAARELAVWVVELDRRNVASVAEQRDGDGIMEGVEIWLSDVRRAQMLGADVDELEDIAPLATQGFVLLGADLLFAGAGSASLSSMVEVLEACVRKIVDADRMGLDTDAIVTELQPSAQRLVDAMAPLLAPQPGESDRDRLQRETVGKRLENACVFFDVTLGGTSSQTVATATPVASEAAA